MLKAVRSPETQPPYHQPAPGAHGAGLVLKHGQRYRRVADGRRSIMTLREILVATDLTVGSELALERTLSFCSGCNVTLLHVLRAALPDPLRMQLHSVIEGYLAD